ncbi:MAG: Binding-protein-dependent transport systems inner membrane component [Methanomicrobiales archaeon 53_19]|jgi:tungstate transport system permease protein|uniref:ABC transporter permease n=1 Tax=Methanocalculus sp. TaxID=2004547 RepID=UPI0007462BA7|nr:ABC transporter permease [Methanocalculus sp.]KUK69527.1 MAG: Binding-protein-dependent transport systems inner membrane component [Methanocalculus sp. 52_23]KUL04660.1 MAG: Binding-protein-dependent transport systems inner membrane component [Methanomicrobiales archaeon 53_19]HIJ06878.1 ABC transporter permease subunit [Methanocalculus sp.]
MNEIVAGFTTALELIISLDPEVIDTAIRSMTISLTATFFATLFAIPIGSVITFSEFHGKKALINLIQTLYALPTVLVGLFVFLLISRAGPLGFMRLLFTPEGMVIAQMILILPILIGLTISALKGVDSTILDTLRSLGATRYQFMKSVVREARYAIMAAVVLGFGRAISEVGAAIMIGGNIRGHTRVLTTAISLETSMGNIALSLALGIILLGIALVINLMLAYVQNR